MVEDGEVCQKGILAVFYIFQDRGAEDESWKADSRIASVETVPE